MPSIPALGQRQLDLCESEASPVYKVSSRGIQGYTRKP